MNLLLNDIKKTILENEPDAKIILYGSYARGNYDNDSDIDLLILINKDKISRKDEVRITYPIYDIEFETGLIISPLIITKKMWDNRKNKTPFYENILKEGIEL